MCFSKVWNWKRVHIVTANLHDAIYLFFQIPTRAISPCQSFSKARVTVPRCQHKLDLEKIPIFLCRLPKNSSLWWILSFNRTLKNFRFFFARFLSQRRSLSILCTMCLFSAVIINNNDNVQNILIWNQETNLQRICNEFIRIMKIIIDCELFYEIAIAFPLQPQMPFSWPLSR